MTLQRSTRSLLAWATLAITVVVACGGQTTVSPTVPPPGASAPAGQSPIAGQTGTTALGSPSPIFDPTAAVDVAVVLDAAKTVEKLIPLAGGSITATGADGTVYRLDIPADALLAETTVGLTPVASITGLPFGSQPHFVQFSPDGLSLFNFAVLTITPAEAIPAGEQIVFGYSGEGKDVILAPPVVNSNEIKINVLHFSGNGVTRGLLADIEPERRRLGGNDERRLNNAMAERLGIERQRQLLGGAPDPNLGDDFADAMRQYEELVVKPRVAAAGESCAAGQLALQTVLGLERQKQLLGIPGNGLDEYVGLMDKVGKVCVVEEFELCVEQHIINRMVPVWLGFERQSQLLGGGGEAAIREAKDLTTKCLTFTLDFESTGIGKIGGGSKYESSVTAKAILHFDPAQVQISGDGELVNTDYEFIVPGCTVTETTGGGTFSVFKLIYVDAAGASTTYNSGPAAFGHIADFVMNYHPGNSSEQASWKCKDSAVQHMVLPAWSTTFLTNHISEVGPTGWTAIDWKIKGGELFAEKKWSLSNSGISEKGSFELHHTPGA